MDVDLSMLYVEIMKFIGILNSRAQMPRKEHWDCLARLPSKKAL